MPKRSRCLIALACLAALGLRARAIDTSNPARTFDIPVTAVAGESWLSHLHRSFGDTSMGKTGHLGPPPPEAGEEGVRWHPAASLGFAPQSVTLHGADLYRINCRGCHGEDGLGAPPEINSVINPVRATSVTLVMQRMKDRGMEMSQGDAAELAKQSKAALLQRLHKGGENMPPFPHLSEIEIAALLAYLNQLAGLPGAQSGQVTLKSSPVRVGEHIVKSTCHTCHDAAGPNPTPEQLEDGAIPPLETLTTRTSLSEFVRKVTAGTPIVMGRPPTPHRGRMPIFYYLSEDEAADVYLYLTLYPPSELADSGPMVALSQHEQAVAGGPPAPRTRSSAPVVAVSEPVAVQQPVKAIDLETVLFLLDIGSFLILMVAGGLFLTVREFKRLSAKSENRSQTAREDRMAMLQRANVNSGRG